MDKQSAPQRKYHPPYEDECPAQPMSDPRTNAAIAEEEADIARHFAEENRPINDAELKRLDCIAESLTKRDIDDAEVVWRAYRQLSALRKEPPALPAEVERAIGDLEAWADNVPPSQFAAGFLRHVATLLRRYAQAPALPAEVEAVAAKLARLRFFLNDDERWPSVGEAAILLRRYAQSVAEKDAEIARLTEAHDENRRALVERINLRDKKLQAVEALCAEAEARERSGGGVLPAAISAMRLRKILREEH